MRRRIKKTVVITYDTCEDGDGYYIDCHCLKDGKHTVINVGFSKDADKALKLARRYAFIHHAQLEKKIF